MIYNLTSFSGVHIYPIVLLNVESRCKVLILQLVWDKFYREVRKHYYDAISYDGVSKFLYLVEVVIDYYFAEFQCSQLSGSSFMEENEKQNKTPL